MDTSSNVKGQTSRVKCRSGFTLLELLISMAIFAILGTFTVMSFRSAGQLNNLRQAANELVSNLRLAQSMSQSGATVNSCDDGGEKYKLCPDATCSICSEKAPKGGYGISGGGQFGAWSSLPTSRYMIFAELLGDGYDLNDDPTIFTVDLPAQTSISMVDSSVMGLHFLKDGHAYDFFGNISNQYFCISHSNFPNVYRKVTLIGATGQIQEEAVAACP
ncbi:MAG: prepilin-type N-terminal cleavage/methylation domain-containing protein [Candidatus Kerfeldbacteria bacterium]|nr:prepilin-type N-terminal cleavage/methylation domain-containing protein [Candidatus Kerfeldbacteria bacterium]